jgi:hypothetical protein
VYARAGDVHDDEHLQDLDERGGREFPSGHGLECAEPRDWSLFLSLLLLQTAGLATAFESTSPKTIFAPTDAAFAALFQSQGITQAQLFAQKDKLETVRRRKNGPRPQPSAVPGHAIFWTTQAASASSLNLHGAAPLPPPRPSCFATTCWARRFVWLTWPSARPSPR